MCISFRIIAGNIKHLFKHTYNMHINIYYIIKIYKIDTYTDTLGETHSGTEIQNTVDEPKTENQPNEQAQKP